MEEIVVSGKLPVLALRGIVVFPNQTVHFDVAREKSVRAVDQAMEGEQLLFLIPQKNIVDDDPAPSQLHEMGTVVRIKQVLRSKNEAMRVLVTGLYRAKIERLIATEPCMVARVEMVEEKKSVLTNKTRAIMRDVNMAFSAYLEMTQHPAQQLQLKMMASTDPGFLADCLAQHEIGRAHV